jgi:hypothetical protein
VAHTHHCKVCGVAVGICDGVCAGGEHDYCTLHHPDPQYQRDLNQPTRKTVVTIPKE